MAITGQSSKEPEGDGPHLAKERRPAQLSGPWQSPAGSPQDDADHQAQGDIAANEEDSQGHGQGLQQGQCGEGRHHQ